VQRASLYRGNTEFSFSLPYLAASASTLAPEEAAAHYDAIPTAGLTHMRITRKSAHCELCAYDEMNFDTITSSSSACSLPSLLSVGLCKYFEVYPSELKIMSLLRCQRVGQWNRVECNALFLSCWIQSTTCVSTTGMHPCRVGRKL
jgi:hypothetical protein